MSILFVCNHCYCVTDFYRINCTKCNGLGCVTEEELNDTMNPEFKATMGWG